MGESIWSMQARVAEQKQREQEQAKARAEQQARETEHANARAAALQCLSLFEHGERPMPGWLGVIALSAGVSQESLVNACEALLTEIETGRQEEQKAQQASVEACIAAITKLKAQGTVSAEAARGLTAVYGLTGAAAASIVDAATASPRCFAERHAAFLADLNDYRTSNLEVTQARVDELAKLHGVPAPRIVGGGNK